MQANDKCDEQESGHDKVGILEEGIGSPLLPELANILRDLTIARPEEALHDYENCEQDWSGSTAQRKHFLDRKSTRLNSSHVRISYAVFCLEKNNHHIERRD